MLRKYYKQLLLVLGILVALYIYHIDTVEPSTKSITVAPEIKPRGHNTILTDIMEVTAKHMLKLSRK